MIKYFGNLRISYRFKKLSLYVLYSRSVTPSNFCKICVNGTCGIILSLSSSRNNGGAGKSTERNKNG
jgi:hypothetical protein